ncbi:hypothetical protein H7I41_07795 [Mycobacterium manitobense]|uniref:Secreted protein n=1 Tax=[Mycobacterium] manitobense TaxID=190147 RepID=A0A9X2YL89_9MYCO|nr:hypothetical protein [[Mycobacterium] manitobense]MCV7169824.1 hypothetical protein [[Mycobacterium] manitobense]
MTMVGAFLAASAAVIAVTAYPLAAHAGAADGDQVVRVQDGKLRCLISTDDVPRGGGPMAVCGLTNGRPFGTSPAVAPYIPQQSLAVVRGTGERFWFSGTLPPADGDVVLGPRETYRVNGWTIRNDPFKAYIVNDFYEHGMTINETEMRQI